MNRDDKGRRRIALTRMDKYVLIMIAIMVAIVVILTVLSACGLRLIRGEIYLFLPAVLMVALVGWGISLLYRRIRSRGAKIAVGLLLGIAGFMVMVVGMSYLSFAATLTVPQRYNTVVAPESGRQLVVLRLMDLDEDRINARHDARLAANPEGDQGVIADDWGYVYTAYAPAAWLFYRPDSLIEGEVHLGSASQGQLMVDWEEDETVGHFFVQNPEAEDGGELRARAG